MQKPDWIFAFASVIGNGHISENIPCQDACRVESHKDYSIAVVCDGAGSCENSHIGSKHVADFSIYHFEKLISSTKWNKGNKLPSQDVWHNKAKKTLFLIRDDLEKLALNNEWNLKSLSCTIIITIILKPGLLVTHIGDGRAGYCNSNNEWFSSIVPFRGELANQTVFITSDIWDTDIIDTYVESRVVEDNIKAICLLSDGCEKASFECNLLKSDTESYFDPNKPYPLFFNPNLKILPDLYKQGKTQAEINSMWELFLINGTEKLKIELDDKTLILGVCLFGENNE